MTFIVPSQRLARAAYDFAVDGGAQGTIALRGDSQIPSGAVITNSLITVQTVLTGASATVGISSEGASDIQSAAAISGAPWSTTGSKRGTLNATATPITTTAARTISAVIGTANLTAGKFLVYVWYVIPQF